MKINKYYNENLEKIKIYQKLSRCKNFDYPNNMTNICFINLKMFLLYFNKIKKDVYYRAKNDYNLITYIYNYLASIKSYLNRKYKAIEKIFPMPYKTEIKAIFTLYWKAGRNKTTIDKLITLRNKFEHEDISGISLNRIYYKDKIIYKIKIKNYEIVSAFIKAYIELKEMKEKIETYGEDNLQSINLRQHILFINAFNKNFGKTKYCLLEPQETEQEIKFYDDLIKKLKTQK